MLPHKTHSAAHPKLSRRGFLALGTGGTLAACSAPAPTAFAPSATTDRGGFAHGIASGDPRADSVLLWTRVSPPMGTSGSVAVSCDIATSADFSDARTIDVVATPTRDHCVKLVVDGLQPGTTYHYRFRTATDTSRAGTTKTLPVGDTPSARFAVVSCANWQEGYFHAYDRIARRHADDPYDALLHLGDYFYEYGLREDAVRPHDPPVETVRLADYRARHAQYRTDPSLQAATALMPLIPIWDDHESANDSARDGAQNHQPATEGSWEDRKAAALRAYYEWMPVRDPDTPGHFWRSYSFGDLATVTAVETRLSARAESLAVEDYVDMITGGEAERFRTDVLGDPRREMFGEVQRDFIVDSFARSKREGQPWRVLANQVIMTRLLTPDLNPYVPEEALAKIRPQWEGIDDFLALSRYNVPLYPDSWDGYPAARDVFFDALREAGVTDMMVLTGDAHEFWANALTASDGERVGVEFVTSSVSSATLADYLGEATADYALLMTRENDDAKYYNALHNGFTDVTLIRNKAVVEMVGVRGLDNPEAYESFRVARFTVRPSKGSLRLRSPKGLNLKQRALFAGLG